MILWLSVLLYFSVPQVRAEQKCQPDEHGVRRLNGHVCASTTRYDDGHRGSCGCGPFGGDVPFNWTVSELLAAPSQKYFDDGGDKRWCGVSCGKCVKLTPTGGFVPLKGRAPAIRESHIFLVTNDCPTDGNEEWCGIADKPGTNEVNSHGYEIHFDLQNHMGQVAALGWDNPEVVWEEVNCPIKFAALRDECECNKS